MEFFSWLLLNAEMKQKTEEEKAIDQRINLSSRMKKYHPIIEAHRGIFSKLKHLFPHGTWYTNIFFRIV